MKMTSYQRRFLARVLLLLFLQELLLPTTAIALTGGPSQPEVQSFEPIGTSDMVDMFTGDMKYNIPLMEVDGYPINLAYSGGISMDQEASWVGLGWNLNAGNIDRNMRGIPDDFKGDETAKEINLRNNVTVGASFQKSYELFGLKNLTIVKDKDAKGKLNFSWNVGLRLNNYNGLALEAGASVGSKIANQMAPSVMSRLNVTADTENGIDIKPSVSFNSMEKRSEKLNVTGSGSLSVSGTYNSRGGMKSIGFGWSVDTERRIKTRRTDGQSRANGNSAITFGTQTYSPTPASKMSNFALQASLTLGKEVLGSHASKTFGGYFSIQTLKEKVSTAPNYGYYNAEYATYDDLKDVNYEKELSISDNSPNLYLPVQTHDIFSVSAHGVGGTYRIYRNDVSNFGLDATEVNSSSFSIGLEFGKLKKLKGGADLTTTVTKSKTGTWTENNALITSNKPVKKQDIPDKPAYEPAYFRSMGEMTPFNINSQLGVQGLALLHPNANFGAVSRSYRNQFGRGLGNRAIRAVSANPVDNIYQPRRARNAVLQPMTAEKAAIVGLQKEIEVYEINQFPENGVLKPKIKIPRIGGARKEHHFSELHLHHTDGARYVYGIPAYNNFQEEYTFSVANGMGFTGDCETGLVNYSSKMMSLENESGRDHYFQKVRTPGYAYSYLLTGILSPDYVDLTGNGISDDDLGTATRFNYSRANDNYHWRVPYHQGKANYNAGRRTDHSDDKGSIVYGGKEIWYMHSIEGKNHIALFYISMRADGIGVVNKDGGLNDNDHLYKLDSVVLYNKQDFLKNGISAYKVKAVHFEYDYGLCPGIPNFMSTVFASEPIKGKLTLRKVYFTFGKSYKGRLSSYKFNYNGHNQNVANYHSKGSDRWGVFKPQATGGCSSTGVLNNVDFPYTPQEKTLADEYAGMWSLNEIILPTGAKINIEYESDDYAFVQDKEAQRMYKIQGFGKTNNYGQRSNDLYSLGSIGDNLFVFVNLEKTATASELDEMFKNLKTAQFNLFVDINGLNNYEFVKCYVDLTGEYGLCNSKQSAYFKLLAVPHKRSVPSIRSNPLSMGVWNWTRIHASEFIYNQRASDNYNADKILRVFTGLAGMVNDVVNSVIGLYTNLKLRNFGRFVNLQRSFVRLEAIGMKKLGGGHRVKKVIINDNWSFTGQDNFQAEDAIYGQEYTYTTSYKNSDNQEIEISSGVAAYEPSIGSDENPFIQPIYTREEKKLVPDIEHMVDEPYGTSYMPSPVIGYSRVEVKSLQHSDVKRTATGKQVFEFYTAKDFPTRITSSEISYQVTKPTFINRLFSRVSETVVTASQGYLIELNDMHGKPKAEYTFAEGAEAPSGGVMHYYQTNPNDPKELNNLVKVVNAYGFMFPSNIGIDAEVFNDYRTASTKVTTVELQPNVDFFTIAGFPLVIPTLFNAYKRDETHVNTAVTVKVVNRYGVNHKTIAIKEGSLISSENLVYESESGQVLVTATQNEFNDKTYQINYPASWPYDAGMGAAYKNLGVQIQNVQLRKDSILLPSGLLPRSFFVPGDLVVVQESSGLVVLCHVYEGTGSKLNLINYYTGEAFYPVLNPNQLYTLEIIRSGRRNLHQQTVQTILQKRHPAQGSHFLIDSVISASAVEFSDHWPFYCDKKVVTQCDTIYTTPLAEIKNFYNTLAAATPMGLAKSRIDLNCLRQNVANNGYGSPDSLFHLDSTGTLAIIEQFKCLDCLDSFAIRQNDGSFIWLYFDDFQSCKVEVCCNTLVDVRDIIPNHPIYTGISGRLSEIFSNCNIESPMDVTYQGCQDNPFGVQPLSIKFTKCGSTCDLNLYMPQGLCYRRLHSMLNISYKNNYEFYATIVVEKAQGVYDTLAVTGGSDCMPLRTVDCSTQCITPTENSIINPYVFGIKGNWRPKRNYAFVENRNYGSQVNNRQDGIYNNYNNYWRRMGSPAYWSNVSAAPEWVWASEITKYSPYGNEIENKDALGRYSAAVFGFNNTLPIAVGANTEYEQVAYEGFEENSEFWVKSNCWSDHFSIIPDIGMNGEFSTDQKHSGKYSMRVFNGEKVSAGALISQCAGTNSPTLDSSELTWPACLCVGSFNPKAGKYILSAWVMQDNSLSDTTYHLAHINMLFKQGSSTRQTVVLKPAGPIIDGWQRIFAEVEIEVGDNEVVFELVAGSEKDAWFDDFRFHPFNGTLKTYAYDQITLKLLAELDENNFATFYEYDQEGALSRLKKETERGIKTLKEVRKQTTKLP